MWTLSSSGCALGPNRFSAESLFRALVLASSSTSLELALLEVRVLLAALVCLSSSCRGPVWALANRYFEKNPWAYWYRIRSRRSAGLGPDSVIGSMESKAKTSQSAYRAISTSKKQADLKQIRPDVWRDRVHHKKLAWRPVHNINFRVFDTLRAGADRDADPVKPLGGCSVNYLEGYREQRGSNRWKIDGYAICKEHTKAFNGPPKALSWIVSFRMEGFYL